MDIEKRALSTFGIRINMTKSTRYIHVVELAILTAPGIQIPVSWKREVREPE
jgi:hypothetical protein